MVTFTADIQLWRPDPDDPLIGRVAPTDGYYVTSFVVPPDRRYMGVEIMESLRHGDNLDINCQGRFPGVDYSPIKPGKTFYVMEGHRKIGIGTIKG